jgi:acetyltransferase
LAKNLVDGGYGGGIFPVDPRAVNICDLRAYGSVQAIGQSIDLAIIATPISKTPEIMRQCVEAEIGVGIIISASGREVGQKGHCPFPICGWENVGFI